MSSRSYELTWVDLFRSLDAMSNESLEEEGSKCPVIRAWMDMPGVVSRASEGKLAEVGKEGLCRDAVSNNVDVLEPIIKEFGSLAQLKIIKAVEL